MLKAFIRGEFSKQFILHGLGSSRVSNSTLAAAHGNRTLPSLPNLPSEAYSKHKATVTTSLLSRLCSKNAVCLSIGNRYSAILIDQTRGLSSDPVSNADQHVPEELR
jgi:hypothetical protein